MEVTGFTIGVVGLAGLVSTCMETFKLIRSVQAFSRDTEMLFIKLDIEREIFTKWAHEVGLLKRHHVDRSLFDRSTDLLISRVLKEMRLLLGRAVGMEGKYGENHSVPGVGYHYQDRERSSKYDDHDASDRQKKVSIGRKVVWTVHGKDELKSLIEELGYFNEKLNQMIPSVEQRQASLKEIREAGADVATWSTLMLAEARTERGSDDEDWSDLASEVVGKAGERVSRSHRRKHSDSDRRRRRDSGSHERRRRRSSDEEDEKRRYRSESTISQSSHRSDRSGGSASSHGSSRSTLVQMMGDIVGSNPRPRSSWR